MNEILAFLLGLVLFPLLAHPLARRYGIVITRIPRFRPACAHSVIGLHPLVKRFIAKGRDGEWLYLWTPTPEFSLRLEKKCYKKRSDVVVLQIRYGEVPRHLYERARTAVEDSGLEHTVLLTPKRGQPSAVQITFECGPFAPAAIASAVGVIIRGIGAVAENGIYASPWGNVDWRRLTETSKTRTLRR